jgi:SAM-dependent methyltransferase
MTEQQDYSPLTRCLACSERNLEVYLDLGSQPLANDFRAIEAAKDGYPLALQVCLSCWHSQLTAAVLPDLLFRDYLYVSGTTTTLRDYFASFSRAITDRFGESLRVLDLASNDGSLLAEFNRLGHVTLGVDPAANLVPLAAAVGVDTLCGYWPTTVAPHLRPGYDIVIAMNVVAHVADPCAFLGAIGDVLAPTGRLFVQTSQARMVENGEFDTAYHEHLSFFNTRSMSALAERAGLALHDVSLVSVHGTSYLWELSTEPAAMSGRGLVELREHEESLGLFEKTTYKRFSERAGESARLVRDELSRLHDEGYALFGYGAAAKGNTFINFASITLDAIADDNSLKHGLLAPGSGIPVISPQELAREERPCAFLIPAWNFRDEIASRISAIRPNALDKGIVYFPSLEVFPLDEDPGVGE